MTRTEAFSMVVTDEVSEWLDRDECKYNTKNLTHFCWQSDVKCNTLDNYYFFNKYGLL